MDAFPNEISAGSNCFFLESNDIPSGYHNAFRAAAAVVVGPDINVQSMDRRFRQPRCAFVLNQLVARQAALALPSRFLREQKPFLCSTHVGDGTSFSVEVMSCPKRFGGKLGE